MAERKQFEKGRMVPVPSVSIIPERDVGKTPILECSHLGIDFGGLTAVNEFNITVGRTEIAGLIGPNGAGKTTVFNLLTKVYQPTRGTILLDGLDTHGKTPAQINRMGIARTFQNIRLFNNLSVEDNVKIGLHNQEKYSMLSGIFRLPKYWRQEKAAHERALELLDQGLEATAIAARLEEEKKDIRLVALLDTLEYLKRGGRISPSVALVGGLLSIKPVVAVENGEVVVLGKARGSKNGNNLLVQEIEKTNGVDFARPYRLAYAGLDDGLLQKYIADSASLWAGQAETLPVGTVGGTIGTHVGPGAVAVAFFRRSGSPGGTP